MDDLLATERGVLYKLESFAGEGESMRETREMKPLRIDACVAAFVAIALLNASPVRAQTVRVDASHAVNTFRPLEALGSTVDRVPSNATDTFFRPDQIKQVLEAGWGEISYRQNTDLFVQAWHWNPEGKWSDPSGKGYFVGEATPTATMIRHSYGYSLPHRGFTRNNGTEFDGYSRLDDGELNSYWKSNPYLTQPFTHEADSLHPQWVVVDLGSAREVSAIRIDWADPYAVRYEVQYWIGGDAMDEQASGEWHDFSFGKITNGKGGTVTLGDVARPMNARFVRVLMTESSNTCDTHGASDRRNCLGYAIREIYVGATNSRGHFTDYVLHLPGQKQTLTYCSSVDPWHQKSDLYVAPNRMESGDQPGLDLFFTSGITRGLPAIIPIAMLYSTPEDAAAEIAYVEERHYPIRYIEMGEEPDGQYAMPEDDAALYLQFAMAIHRVDPKLKLGGPVFEGVDEDIKSWADARGRTSWFGRFLDYLRSHGRISDLAFMSFEHYPYDGCETPWKNLYQEPRLLTHIMDVWRSDGLSASVPLLDTETNAHGGEAAVDIFGALWLGDTFGAFLTHGGQGTFYYHDLPYSPAHPACANSWGTYHMFMVNKDYVIRSRTSQFYAAQLITQQWVVPGMAKHRAFKAASDVKDAAGDTLVTAYAVLRPDGQWALLLINKDHDHAHRVRVMFRDADGDRTFRGTVTLLSFGKAQYVWHPNRKLGYADPDLPPAASKISAGPETLYTLPAASINVLRGRVATASK
jgi:F5/8 type C domain